jgi:ketosteroid isomerase-like protein
VAALFAEDGIIFRAQNEPVAGHAAIQEYMAAEYTKNPTSRVEWTTDRVEVAASGDLASEYGTYSETNDTGEGDQGRFVTVYRKVNGEWKVAADMSASTKPAAAAMTSPM